MILEKYVDKLPIPKKLKAKETNDEFTYYEVKMKETKHKFHRDMPKTKVWGYEGLYPGPTIEVASKEVVKVKWINDLPVSEHLLPVDTTVHGAGLSEPRVRTVVHLHGGLVSPESDGYPEAWFTKGFEHTGPFFTNKVYTYPNDQRASTYIYHDHALGITRLNVYAGLVGLYIIRDKKEEALNLPKGKYEIPLLIQDKSFNEDGSLFYPSGPLEPPGNNFPPLPIPSIVPEFFADTILVNGKAWPYLEVEPRKYRFRIVNGSNSRFYSMKFDGECSPPWYQIGTDGGLLEEPVKLQELILAPAERADVIVDFSGFKGLNITLTNNAPTPFPMGSMPDENTTGQIMQFKVTRPLCGKDRSTIPPVLSNIMWLSKKDARKTRELALQEEIDVYGRPMMMLDGKMWDDPITEKPRLNTIEVWKFINLTMDTHPMHLHLVQFQIIDRRPFDVAHYMETGKIVYIDSAILPEPNERGWKDTIRANPGEVTRIIARFEGFDGLYVWHCHILEHEDYEMMRPYKVVKKKKK